MIKVRGQDRHGEGHYQAPRKGRKHSGIDVVSHENEVVCAYEGGKVSKIGYPYNPSDHKKGHLRYVEITVPNGNRHRYFYTGALVDVGDVIEKDQTIGYAQGLQDIYIGITDHIHFEIMLPGKPKRFVDPVDALVGLGYEFE